MVYKEVGQRQVKRVNSEPWCGGVHSGVCVDRRLVSSFPQDCLWPPQTFLFVLNLTWPPWDEKTYLLCQLHEIIKSSSSPLRTRHKWLIWKHSGQQLWWLATLPTLPAMLSCSQPHASSNSWWTVDQDDSPHSWIQHAFWEEHFCFRAGLGYGADCWAPLTNHKSILSRKGLIRIIKPNFQYGTEVRNRICPHMTARDHYVCLMHLSEACALSSAPRVQFDFTDHTDAGGCQRRQIHSALGWPLLPLLLR